MDKNRVLVGCRHPDRITLLARFPRPPPHPSQMASIIFRTNIKKLFELRPSIHINVRWTPGHAGTSMMKRVDKMAKHVGKSRGPYLMESYASRSKVEAQLRNNMLQRWQKHIDDLPNLSPSSGSYHAM